MASLRGRIFGWLAQLVASLGGRIFGSLDGATYGQSQGTHFWRPDWRNLRPVSGVTFLVVWLAQPLAGIRVCVACETALGHRSGDPLFTLLPLISFFKVSVRAL